MRFTVLVAAGGAFAVMSAMTAAAEPLPPSPSAAASTEDSDGLAEIIVTARKREETLLDVPVAVTSISGDMLAKRGVNSVREAALFSPGLNISSDGAGRAFVSIRGVGVTLVGTVQPGVGLFVDGIYRPNTAYLNNPLLDVERIEILRGPQGTLYGKNTLGGAINVVTRQPGNQFEARGQASYAGPDNRWLVSGAMSAPIVPDRLAVRVAASHREQDGFIGNVTPGVGGKSNPLNSDSINATVRATPGGDVILTLNGYYDWIRGANTPYARVSGPTDYLRVNQFNTRGITTYRYRGVNAKLEAPLDMLRGKVILQAGYDLRNTSAPDNDADFGPANIVRSSGRDKLRTETIELRIDSSPGDSVSMLIGLFYSNERADSDLLQNVVPRNRVVRTIDHRKGDTSALFATLFWKPIAGWEIAAGLRYDHESREAKGSIAGLLTPRARIKSDQVQPKLTVTRRWNDALMTYASVARGYRGGGFNPPNAPIRTYKADSVWTYELGGKYVARGVSLAADIFYNDYQDYIGLNSIAPAVPAGLVTVDLNSGDVESYGFELEAQIRPTPRWSLTGSFTYQHSRITDDSLYRATTRRTLPSDRLTFQPDMMFSLSSDYAIPIGDDLLTISGGLQGKGKRLAATLNETTPTFLNGYTVASAAISYRHGGVELTLFGTNLFNKKYFESYIERTTLQLANLPSFDLGVIGDRRRYGVRMSLAL